MPDELDLEIIRSRREETARLYERIDRLVREAERTRHALAELVSSARLALDILSAAKGDEAADVISSLRKARCDEAAYVISLLREAVERALAGEGD